MVKNATKILILALFVLFLVGCRASSPEKPREPALTAAQPAASTASQPGSESRARMAATQAVDQKGFKIRPFDLEMREGRAYLPVGAHIESKEGKVKLDKAVNEMAKRHNFSVSWASDVDTESLVKVYIRPEDNFWDALDNLLRQQDYFYEQEGDTIFVHYKTTRRYTLPMPALKEDFETSVRTSLERGSSDGETGSGKGASTGEVTLKSAFRDSLDFWSTLERNLKEIMDIQSASLDSKNKTDKDQNSPKDNQKQSQSIAEGKGTLMIDPSVGTITVSAPLKTHEKIRNYIEHLKREVYKQVVLQVKIVEVRLNDESSMGINWSNIFLGSERNDATLRGNVGFGEDYITDNNRIVNNVVYPTHKFLRYFTLDNQSFSLIVDAMKEYGETNVLSSPKVSILNGHGATLFVGEDNSYIEGYKTDTVEGAIERIPIPGTVFSGVGLGVTANIIDEDEVILYIIPSTRELIRPMESRGNPPIDLPRTIRRELATTCRIHDGETLIIGGHIDRVETDNENRVPFLGDMPGLGWLFKHESKTSISRELVIFITPKILVSSR